MILSLGVGITWLISVNNSEIKGDIINYNGNVITLYFSANNIISYNSINYNKGKKSGTTVLKDSVNVENEIKDQSISSYYLILFISVFGVLTSYYLIAILLLQNPTQ